MIAKLILDCVNNNLIKTNVLSSANAAIYADAAKKVSITKTAKVTAGKSTVVKLKNNKKKVKWKVTKGTKYVKITKRARQAVR